MTSPDLSFHRGQGQPGGVGHFLLPFHDDQLAAGLVVVLEGFGLFMIDVQALLHRVRMVILALNKGVAGFL